MFTTLAGTLGMCLLLGTSPPLTKALQALEACPNIRSQHCLQAAAVLTNAGDEATSLTREHMVRMATAGQVLALTVIDSNRQATGTNALVEVVDDPRLGTIVRTMALSQLSARDTRSHRITGVMLRLLADQDATIRAASVRALGDRAHKENKQVLTALKSAARDRNAKVRAEAVLGLGFAGVPALGPAITRGLSDTDAAVRRAAALALRLVRYPPAIEPLIEVLTETDRAMRRVASEALRFQTGENYGDDYALWLEWHKLRP